MSNIAEGFGRGTQGEFVQFLGFALGSADETRSHLCSDIARDTRPPRSKRGAGPSNA
ncbi:MAG: four helix bundle protein [Planctomycetes bacterium]|nr:four helix bundle protein [Planctomycetota bacterium]